MSPFASLTALERAFFALWSLLLCLAYIVVAVLGVRKKRYRFTVAALPTFALAYFAWQVIFDFALDGRGIESAVAVSRTLCALPWGAWCGALGALTVGACVLAAFYLRYAKTSITPDAIKDYLDRIPCGVCCWLDNGRVLFSNICMNELCVALTDGPLRNGNSFAEAVAGGLKEADGKMWRFACREVVYGGERMHEMIASDVTAEYAKTQALEKDKAELSRINRELKEYTLGIDETVRRQEILQAKVNIHDEMNRLMLTTVAAEDGDAAAMDAIFALWEQNALLLCMDAEDAADEVASARIEALAEALRIRLTWATDVPLSLDEGRRGLVYTAAREALANAAKHAHATEMAIAFDETEDGVDCRFVSDGVMPQGAVTFTGGLANLARLAAKEGAVVSVAVGERFTLSVRFPREKQPNG